MKKVYTESHRSGFALPLIVVLIIAFGLIGSITYAIHWHNNTPFAKTETKLQNGTLLLPSPSQTPKLGYSEDSKTLGIKTYVSIESKYSFDYPESWIINAYDKNHPTNQHSENGYVEFNTRQTTTSEVEDKARGGYPQSIGRGALGISRFQGEFENVSEKDFFNLNYHFWFKGNINTSGGILFFTDPKEILIGGKRAIKQISHSTTTEGYYSSDKITTIYRFWKGNNTKEYVDIRFTYSNNNKDYNEKIKQFDQMVSTFKFTN